MARRIKLRALQLMILEYARVTMVFHTSSTVITDRHLGLKRGMLLVSADNLDFILFIGLNHCLSLSILVFVWAVTCAIT